MGPNNQVLLITNEFELKTYMASIDRDFSYVNSHIHFDDICNSDIESMPIYISYFFKAFNDKYSEKCNSSDFTLFKLEVADKVIRLVNNMFFKSYFTAGTPINHLFNNLPEALSLCEELRTLVIDEFVSHHCQGTYTEPEQVFYALLFYKSICIEEQLESIDSCLIDFVSRHMNNFYLPLNSTNEDIESFINESYDKFINNDLVLPEIV